MEIRIIRMSYDPIKTLALSRIGPPGLAPTSPPMGLQLFCTENAARKETAFNVRLNFCNPNFLPHVCRRDKF